MSSKKLSNPFGNGGGGHHFEVYAQANFAVLMLTGGYAPCLPCYPIKKIKLQAKIDGLDTDDLTVFVQDKNSKEQRKLLGQVKHSIAITEKNESFGYAMQAAWNDFNNPEVFVKDKDVIALITGPLSAIDTHNVRWLLEQARHTEDVDDFFKNVRQAKFSPPQSGKKLDAIRHNLKVANNGNDVSNDELYNFLKHFHLLGYDFDNKSSVALSLLYSHISQTCQQHPEYVWAKVVDIVQTSNKNAGTITRDRLLNDLPEVFKKKDLVEMPKGLKKDQTRPETDWAQHNDATYLALAILIGAWQDKCQCDLEAIKQLFGISYDEWLDKAREILHSSGSPLSFKNGIWKVVNRTELWDVLGSRIFDQDLDTFKSLAVSVLKEPNPAFELPAESRYVANIHGKALKHSDVLRKGIAEGLAILGSRPNACGKCSQGKAEVTSMQVVDQLLADANWVLWGSLNDLLPTLAEAAPGKFLELVEKAMRLTPCPFDELFSQEGRGIIGGNYLAGLLWALEGLAWDQQYLVRVCVVLSELADHDPGGQWANRPSNSLVTILLPWFPQTRAPFDKRKVAVRTILREQPDIAWDLIIQLLPGQRHTSTESHRPSWRNTVPDDWKKSVTHQEYWQQVSFYAELAVAAAGQDIIRLSTLIDHFDSLPTSAFDQLLKVLVSKSISELPEEKRSLIWDHLNKFISKHRRFSNAKWALPDEPITRIEQVAKQLTPTNLSNLFKHLFTNQDFDLYDENDNWEEQQKKLNIRRETAISEIFQQDGVKGVTRFAESVSSPGDVGYALGIINDKVFEQSFLPHFLDSADNKRKALVSSFIWRRYFLKGWDWCDGIDKSDWTPKQIGQFLTCLPFTKEVWGHVSEWLQDNESEYWSSADTNTNQIDSDLSIAIDKLIEHQRPYAAINCLGKMKIKEQSIDTKQCIRALLATLSFSETSNKYYIVELIKFLQTEPLVNQDDLSKVEWTYIPLLNEYPDAAPQSLECKLANDPEFFCEIIQRTYRSNKENKPSHEPRKQSEADARRAWQLLHKWKTPPGQQKDGIFNKEHFTKWLQRVKVFCEEYGYLEVAFIHIGAVLIYTPRDPDGLWIHQAVADALDDREADDMRSGFRRGTLNLRVVYTADPTGKPEKELAEQFRNNAEEIENAGFYRFAVTLRNLESYYKREAKQIISDCSYLERFSE